MTGPTKVAVEKEKRSENRALEFSSPEQGKIMNLGEVAYGNLGECDNLEAN